MAERERLTNKERRALAREERKRKEAEAARKRKRDRIRNTAITIVVVALIGAVIAAAFLGRPGDIDEAILISSEAAEEARQAAGCEVLADRQPLEERYHFEPEAMPPAETLYGQVRPTHSGPHTNTTHPVDTFSREIDERVTTHNLEHGAISVWYDPAQVESGTTSDIESWADTLNANGFRDPRAGSGILVSPYEDPGISSGKPVAFRAWGTAMDCDEWDETVANAFVIENFGTHGIGPERTFAPYPDDVLGFEDREVEDSDAPVGGDVTGAEMETGAETGTEPGAETGAEGGGDAGDETG